MPRQALWIINRGVWMTEVQICVRQSPLYKKKQMKSGKICTGIPHVSLAIIEILLK